MTKTIIATVILTLFGSATFAMARAEGRSGKCLIAKMSKKDRLPEKKNTVEKPTKQTAIGVLPEKKDIEITAGPDVGIMSGIMSTHINMRTIIVAIEN